MLGNIAHEPERDSILAKMSELFDFPNLQHSKLLLHCSLTLSENKM